jgi:hypothetical protein
MNEGARLWHPWLRINRVLRAMLHEILERGGLVSGQDRVQEGARAVERDPAGGLGALHLGVFHEQRALRVKGGGRNDNLQPIDSR